MSTITDITNEYNDQDFMSFLIDGIAPAHCTSCGAHVQDSEIDLNGTEFPCPDCCDRGTIKSVLILAGHI